MTSSWIVESRRSILTISKLVPSDSGEVPTASQLERSVSFLAGSTVELTSNALGGAALAGRNHDEHFHEAIVDVATSALNNEYILVSDRGLKAD